MRSVVFTPAARFEILGAQDWYENEVASLGRRFRSELEACLARIADRLLQFPVVHKNVRRALLKRFPYALLFVMEADESLTVVASFHGSRDPIRWQERLR